MLLTIGITFIYVVAISLILALAIQGIYLRSITQNLSEKELLHKNNATSGGGHHGSTSSSAQANTLRSYSLSCDMRSSRDQTAASSPDMTTTLPTFCSDGDALNTRTLPLQNAFWLVVDTTRSSREFYDDVLNRRVSRILFIGHPCLVRIPTKSEQDRLKKRLAKYSQGKAQIIALCDERNFVDIERNDACTVMDQAFAITVNPAGDWPRLIRAYAEEEVGSTLTHVWGYSSSGGR
jgi:hypothetical protein